jgi:hypothetical protein
MRRWLRPLWIFLALLFLLEAWLWERLEPLVAAFVDFIAWEKLKARLRKMIEALPPAAALIVFIVPVVVLLPFKLLGFWLLARGYWLAAVFTYVMAKLVGLGVAAFVFDATRDKLLQMAWFRRLYEWVLWLRDWAREETEPIRARIRQFAWFLKPQRAGRFLRRLIRLRRRAYRARAA